MQLKKESAKSEKLLKAVQEVLSKLDADSETVQILVKSKAEFLPALHQCVQARLLRHNVTIGMVLRNTEASNLFLQRGRLKAVANFHQQMKQQLSIVDIARKTFDNRDKFWQLAEKANPINGKDHHATTFFIFYRMIKAYLSSKNSSFELVMQNEAASSYFTRSGRLCMAAKFHAAYLLVKSAPENQSDAVQSVAPQPEKPGLLTQIGAKGITDKSELKRRIQEIQLQDGNARDPEILNAANEVAGLIECGLFDEYLADLARINLNPK